MENTNAKTNNDPVTNYNADYNESVRLNGELLNLMRDYSKRIQYESFGVVDEHDALTMGQVTDFLRKATQLLDRNRLSAR